MKISSLSLLPVLSALFIAPVLAQGGQAATAPGAPAKTPDPFKQSVALPAQGTSLDDDLIALGRAAKINVIADASTWPADAPALSGARNGTPVRLLENNEALPLSRLRQGATILVWARPDILVLARRIAAGEDIRRIALPPVTVADVTDPPAVAAPVAPPARLFAPGAARFGGLDIPALIENARAAQKAEPQLWDARWNAYLATLAPDGARPPGWTRDVALSALPPDLHAYALVRAQQSLLPADLMGHWKAWVTEDFWKTARLNIRDIDTTVAGKTITDPPQKKAVSMLFIHNTLQVAPGQRGNTMMSIAVLGDAPAASVPAASAPAPTP